jgi:fructokinase
MVSIGEILWDVFESGEALTARQPAYGGAARSCQPGNGHASFPGEHLGGAPFNFAAHAARLEHTVHFISAVGEDERGRRALQQAARLGLSTRYIRRVPEQATGVVSVAVDAAGQPAFTIHRPAAYDFPELSPGGLEHLSAQSPAWIYFGTLAQMSPQTRELTFRLIESNPGARRLYDVNLRPRCYEPELVVELMRRASLVKLNEEEVRRLEEMFDRPQASLEEFCRGHRERFGWEGVCVTRGAQGCVALLGGEYVEAPGYRVQVADTVGAGDAFAAAFVHGLNCGWPAREVADFANRVGALVASRPGAIPPWTLEEAQALSASGGSR